MKIETIKNLNKRLFTLSTEIESENMYLNYEACEEIIMETFSEQVFTEEEKEILEFFGVTKTTWFKLDDLKNGNITGESFYLTIPLDNGVKWSFDIPFKKEEKKLIALKDDFQRHFNENFKPKQIGNIRNTTYIEEVYNFLNTTLSKEEKKFLRNYILVLYNGSITIVDTWLAVSGQPYADIEIFEKIGDINYTASMNFKN